MKLLNESLYESLIDYFDAVDLREEGLVHSSHSPKVSFGIGQHPLQTRPETDGEHYMCACPYCHDRLLINHRWGEPGPDGGSGDLRLARCCRGCLDRPGRREELREMIFPGKSLERLRLRVDHTLHAEDPKADDPARWCEASRVSRPMVEFRLPSRPVPVDELPGSHPASERLRKLGFDPEELSGLWGVGYWESRPTSMIGGRIPRILIPVYGTGRSRRRTDGSFDSVRPLLGWVAPAIDPVGPGDLQVESCSFMRKSHILYGEGGMLDRRSLGVMPSMDGPLDSINKPFLEDVESPIVVVEDPMDVWRLGSGAVALFGAGPSRFQRELLVRNYRHRPIVILFDRGSSEVAEEAARALQAGRPKHPDSDAPNHMVAIARLPEGRDTVRDCTRDEAWGQAFAAIREWIAVKKPTGRRRRPRTPPIAAS